MSIQEILTAMARAGTIEIRVTSKRLPRRVKVNSGIIKKIDMRGVAVLFDGMSYDNWFSHRGKKDDERSNYIEDLELLNHD